VLPDSTFALVTVDLNPSGGQKVEAIKTLRKFPSWKKRTGLTPTPTCSRRSSTRPPGTVRASRWTTKRDVKPWIGSRAAFGGVQLGDGKPRQCSRCRSRTGERRAGVRRAGEVHEASKDDDFGWTLTDDYIIASDSTAHAEAIVSEGKKSPLSQERRLPEVDRGGGRAWDPERLCRSQEPDDPGRHMGCGHGRPQQRWRVSSTGQELAKAMKDFKGAAAGLRFADGGIELASSGGGATDEGDKTVGKHVGALPKDTAAVVALAVPEKLWKDLSSEESRRTACSRWVRCSG
jgi:hypothetical protein